MTEIIRVEKETPIYAAPNGDLVARVPSYDSVRVYTKEVWRGWVQVEYGGKAAWARLPVGKAALHRGNGRHG